MTRHLSLLPTTLARLTEIAALLQPYGIKVVSAGELGLDEPEETEDSFAGNARIKAHYAAKESGLPALSDDSGISVDALDGRTGRLHGRLGRNAEWPRFRDGDGKVWTKLEALNAPEPRTATFNSTLCLAWPDGHEELFVGKVDGRLVWPMRGDRGFGYDPMFLPNGEDETFGEMDPDKKHRMSHRADAFRKLVDACFD